MGKNSTCDALPSPTRVDIGGKNLKTALQRTRRVDLLNQKRARLVVFVVQKVLRQLQIDTVFIQGDKVSSVIFPYTSNPPKETTWRKRTRILSPS